MKTLILILAFALMPGMILLSQTPQAFKYQAIARDEAGNILSMWDISLRISLIQEGDDGKAVYVETHRIQTNIYGLINLIIGEGDIVNGDFCSIKWGENRHYIKIEMDINAGENYKEAGTSQLYAVPYALYAEQAGKIVENKNDTPATQSQPVKSKSSANNSGGNRNGTPNSKLAANGDSYLNVNTGNVGIGTNNPNESALVDVSSTEKGFLPPRVTTVQMTAITNPAEGLTVYNTNFDRKA